MSELLVEFISEYRGQYPDVPLAPGIDLAGLQEDDDKPFFVTLPLVKVGGKSNNGFTWEAADVARVVHEINTKKPEGNPGHIKPENRSTQYDLPKLRWVGAAVVDGTAYGKAYIPKYAHEVREYFKLAKRTNARVGTSVYGLRGSQGLADMTLESIDLGHPDRLGSPDAAAVPHITSELEQEEPNMGDTASDLLIAEYKKNWETSQTTVAELQGTVKQKDTQIAELQQAQTTLVALVAELNLGEKPLEAAKAIISELTTLRTKVLVSEIDSALNDNSIVKNAAIRPYLRKFLVRKDGAPLVATIDEAKAIITEQLADPDMIELSKKLVVEMRGGSAYVGKSKDDGDLQDTPENRAKASAWAGLN